MSDLLLPLPAARQIACSHCGTLFFATQGERFCCAGCSFVYNLIQSEGLETFYQLRDANPPACPVPAQTSTSTYEYCDDPAFIQKSSPDGIRLRFYLEGMNCAACLWLLEKLPSFCADAAAARIDMSTSTIEVRRRPNGSFARIAQTLNRFGFRPHPLRETESAAVMQTRERRRDLMRIGVAAAATGNIMILAVSLYGGATGDLGERFRLLIVGLAAPVLTYGAWPFYVSALASLRSKRLNLDVPIVIAILAGVVTSVWSLFAGAGDVYFDSLSMLVLLLLSSRFLLKSLQHRRLSATNLEDELLLGHVVRVGRDGLRETVASTALATGDIIEVATDTVVPVDADVVKGRGSISTAMMTGESAPLTVESGMRVEAGSRNLEAPLTLKVINPGSKSRLAQILRDTEESALSKNEFVHFADRISQVFIFVVLLAAATLVASFLASNPQEGIARALALVIVTCPCVFGIAIPLSMSLAIRHAATHGIIIKNADAIERLWSVHTLFFDKTGTLTKGDMSVIQLNADNPSDLGILLGLEKNMVHPVARAMTRHLQHRGVTETPLEDLRPLVNGGVAANFRGVQYHVRPLEQELVPCSGNLVGSYGLFADGPRDPAKPLVTFQIGDEVRSDAHGIMQWAREQKFETCLLSGDRRHVVEKCASRLGFKYEDIRAEVSPEMKAMEIRTCLNGTAMIGDGANDAAALAAADVGIAVCGSLDVSLRAADVYLTRPRLESIPLLFRIARYTRFAIYRNLLFSASFNIVAGILAAAGLMTPLWAAVLMPLSSVTILLSAAYTGRKISRAVEAR